MFDFKNNHMDQMYVNEDLCHQKSCVQRAYFCQHQIDVLTEALINIESNLKEVSKLGRGMSKDQILLKINEMSNFKEGINKKLDVMCSDINIFSQR